MISIPCNFSYNIALGFLNHLDLILYIRMCTTYVRLLVLYLLRIYVNVNWTEPNLPTKTRLIYHS